MSDETAATPLLRTVLRGYRSGALPARGTGALFDRTPPWLWATNQQPAGLPARESVTIDTDFGSMTLPLRDHGPRQILVFGHLRNERPETELLSGIAARVGSVLDIGGNVGWYTRVLGNGGARVLAFEPGTAYPYLAINAGRVPNATAFDIAVGAEVGDVTFYQSEVSALSSASRPVGQAVTVPMTTVDQIAADHEIRPEFIKCDVEGGELAVLSGAEELRSSPDAPMWLLEVNERFLTEQGESLDELDDMLSGNALYSLDSDGRWTLVQSLTERRGVRRGGNVLVVPPARLSLLEGLVDGM